MFKLSDYFLKQEEAASPEQPSGGMDSLMDVSNEPAAEPAAEPEGDEDGNQEPTADRPEWLPEKFKSAEDLAESYKGLEGKLGSFTGAPEEYELNTPEGIDFSFYEGTESDINGFKGLAKEMGINQDGFDKIMDFYINSESQRAAIDSQQRQEASLTRLGDSAKDTIKNFTAKAQGALSADDFSLLQHATSNAPDAAAAVIQLVNKLVLKGETAPMGNDTSTQAPEKTKGELQEMMKDPRYQSDTDYRKQVSDGFKRLFN